MEEAWSEGADALRRREILAAARGGPHPAGSCVPAAGELRMRLGGHSMATFLGMVDGREVGDDRPEEIGFIFGFIFGSL